MKIIYQEGAGQHQAPGHTKKTHTNTRHTHTYTHLSHVCGRTHTHTHTQQIAIAGHQRFKMWIITSWRQFLVKDSHKVSSFALFFCVLYSLVCIHLLKPSRGSNIVLLGAWLFPRSLVKLWVPCPLLIGASDSSSKTCSAGLHYLLPSERTPVSMSRSNVGAFMQI